MRRIKENNYLDLVPVCSDKFRVEISKDSGLVTFFIENKGIFNFLAQKMFKKPRFSQVHLEEFGSYIWTLIDGKKNIKTIADLLYEKYGSRAEPLYPRISMYIETLKNYNFISFKS